jgi:predicted dinucleotide-binding enzyme
MPLPLPDLGVLGTGRMGLRLATTFARAGRRVVLGSRDRARAESLVRTLAIPGLVAGSHADAVAAAQVLPAIFHRDGLLEALLPHAAALAGKPLIDIANPFNDDYSDYTTAWDDSAAEILQRALPQARIVGAFKNTWWEVFDAPLFDGAASDVLVTGDDADAKAAFLRLAAGTPFRYLDAGPLHNARIVERLTLVTSRVGRELGISPRMGWRLLGDPAESARRDRLGLDALIANV